jgi:hypothetical protein
LIGAEQYRGGISSAMRRFRFNRNDAGGERSAGSQFERGPRRGPGRPRKGIAAAEAPLETERAADSATPAPDQDAGNGRRRDVRLGGVLSELLTEDELAAELNRTTQTVRRWRQAGTGPPFVLIGRFICYRVPAVEAWIVSRERPSGMPIAEPTRRRR